MSGRDRGRGNGPDGRQGRGAESTPGSVSGNGPDSGHGPASGSRSGNGPGSGLGGGSEGGHGPASGGGAPDVLVRIVEARRRRLAEEPDPAAPAAAAERAEPLTPGENPFLAALLAASLTGADPDRHRLGEPGSPDAPGDTEAAGPNGERSPGSPSHRPAPGSSPSHRPESESSPSHRPAPESSPSHRPESESSPSHRPAPGSSPSYRPALRSRAGEARPASRSAGSGDGENAPTATRPRAAVIAEVKMGSPRIGSLAGRVDPEAQARLYARHGAAALSVVVEPDFFGGSYELLARCREASGLPAIAKDFVVDGRQLEWAKAAGADAVLLIASLHPADELARWARRARALGLVPLVETHDADDLAKLGAGGAAGAQGWELVGVNNRDLRTFRVDLDHSIRQLPRLPAGALKVAESGIGSGADVDRLAAAGFDAFLVGESLLLADDPVAQLEDLVGRGREAG